MCRYKNSYLLITAKKQTNSYIKVEFHSLKMKHRNPVCSFSTTIYVKIHIFTDTSGYSCPARHLLLNTPILDDFFCFVFLKTSFNIIVMKEEIICGDQTVGTTLGRGFFEPH